MRKYPDPKTTTFGGVATGNMNAHNAETAAAINRAYQSMPSATASDAIIGYIIDAVAVFDVISVKAKTSPDTSKNITSTLTPSRPISREPIHSDSPVLTKPLAIARPPPNNRRMPHGSFTAVGQSIKRSPFRLTEGIMNSTIAKTIAISPSLSPWINFDSRKDRVIVKLHEKTQ